MQLKGSIAVVVGGATGIGAGVCRALSAKGAAVQVCDRDYAGAQALADELERLGGTAAAYAIDVVDEESIAAAEAAIRSRHGRVDLLFANAGVISLKPFEQTTADDWRWILDINVIGCVSCVRAFLPAMRAQHSASRVVVTSSVAALRTPEMTGQTMYMASKAAQLGFCNALRTELAGTNVGLSVIFPGPVASQLRQKSEASRPGAIQLEVPKAVLGGGGSMPPEEAGERIVAAVVKEQAYITTHPGDGPLVRQAQDAVMAAFEPS
jgi:NAD(P)-dependent dehydrogenase (short-subunit alcohol dehydrogenase family)